MLKSLLAAVVTLALLTCPFPARAYEKTILKVGMGDPIDSEMGAIGTRFKEVVEARSEGKVEVQLFPSGQLGDETEMIQNVRAGNLDIAVVGIANTVPFVKKLGILTMPYLFDDMYDVVRATTGPAHDLLNGYAIRRWLPHPRLDLYRLPLHFQFPQAHQKPERHQGAQVPRPAERHPARLL